MKRKLTSLSTLITALLSAFAVAFHPAPAPSPPTHNPAAFWKMDDLSSMRSDSVGTIPRLFRNFRAKKKAQKED